MHFSCMSKRPRIIFYILQLVCILMFYASIEFLEFSISYIFLIFCIVIFVLVLFWSAFSYALHIDNKGVEVIKRDKVYSMKWEDIKVIGLTSNKHAVPHKYSSIYFDSRNTDEIQYQYQELNFKQYSNKYFGAEYSKKIVNEITKYCDKPIQSILQTEGNVR